MFLHRHPYPPFIPEKATKLIVGTLPPPRFSTGDRKPDDVDFCYGSRNGQLWKILDRIYALDLVYLDSSRAVQQRKDFLNTHGIGICDIVESCKREKIDASDLGMKEVELRDLVAVLRQHPSIGTLLFMGGNSKNGPEYFFRKILKNNQMNLYVVSEEVPRVHRFSLDEREVRTVSFTAPSGSANRAIGSMQAYKKMKQENPAMNVFDFRVLQYRPFFKD